MCLSVISLVVGIIVGIISLWLFIVENPSELLLEDLEFVDDVCTYGSLGKNQIDLCPTLEEIASRTCNNTENVAILGDKFAKRNSLWLIWAFFILDFIAVSLFLIASLLVIRFHYRRRCCGRKETPTARKIRKGCNECSTWFDCITMPVLLILTALVVAIFLTFDTSDAGIDNRVINGLTRQDTSNCTGFGKTDLKCFETCKGISSNDEEGLLACGGKEIFQLFLLNTTGPYLKNFTRFECDKSVEFSDEVKDELEDAYTKGFPLLLATLFVLGIDFYLKIVEVRHDSKISKNGEDDNNDDL